MDLVRSWLGQALRAGAAAAVAPAAIVAALLLSGVGGSGLGGLGGLSQALSGPEPAGSADEPRRERRRIARAVDRLAAADRGDRLTAPGDPAGAPQGPGPGVGPDGGRDRRDSPSGSVPTPGGDQPGPAPPDAGGGPPGVAPPTPPGPAPGGGVVEGTGDTVKDVAGGTPVGPTVEDAVDGLVGVCRRLGCP